MPVRFLGCGVHRPFLAVSGSVHAGDVARRVHLDSSKISASMSGT